MSNRARHPAPVPEASPRGLVDVMAWNAAEGRARIGAGRIDETARAIRQVAPARIAMAIAAALVASLILPLPTCAAWMSVSLALDGWCWFATRSRSRGHGQAEYLNRSARVNFVISSIGILLCWQTLCGLLWFAGSIEGHATGLALCMFVCAMTAMVFYNAPIIFLAAGMAPAISVLTVIAAADGFSWRHMLPVWIMLGLGAIASLGRAMNSPSVQQSRRRINASLRNFEILAENVSDVISRTDVNGVRQYLSPGCFAVLGYHPHELIGTRTTDFHHPDDDALVADFVRRMASDVTQAARATVRVRHKDGRWLSLQVSGRAIIEDGVLTGMIGVSRDVTEQVEIETALLAAKAQAEAANLAKAEFLANVSHEIRTPMNGILGALHLLECEPISEAGRELMRHAEGSGRMLSQLLNDVLDFSKIEAGQLDLAPEAMDVREALGAVVALLDGQARMKGVNLSFEVFGECPWIEADPVRVRQAMFNLLGNAVKFTAHGRVTARLTIQALARQAGSVDRRQVCLEVEDTGIGISLEAQARLFERFRQGEEDTQRRFGGTGLGLAITEALARMMNGEITVSSVEGHGSTFRMVFEAPSAEPVSVAEIEEGLLHGLNILLVEDNATNRLVARTMLGRLGAAVSEAEDGLAGVEAARAGAYDLILMDIQMPRMDGVKATRAIRGLPGASASVPIIGLTANVMVHQRAEYLAAGMNGVVGKPISPAVLLTEIGRVVSEMTEADAERPSLADAG